MKTSTYASDPNAPKAHRSSLRHQPDPHNSLQLQRISCSGSEPLQLASAGAAGSLAFPGLPFYVVLIPGPIVQRQQLESEKL